MFCNVSNDPFLRFGLQRYCFFLTYQREKAIFPHFAAIFPHKIEEKVLTLHPNKRILKKEHFNAIKKHTQ